MKGSVNVPGASAADLAKMRKNMDEKMNGLATLPACTEADDGKILRVVNGKAAWDSIPEAEGVSV